MKAIRPVTSDKLHSQNEARWKNKPKNYMPPYHLMCGIKISKYLLYITDDKIIQYMHVHLNFISRGSNPTQAGCTQ
jgi:hypothetical protein